MLVIQAQDANGILSATFFNCFDGHGLCHYFFIELNRVMTEQRQCQVFIGTSNIVVPGTKQSFPEAFQQKSRLHFYSSLFN